MRVLIIGGTGLISVGIVKHLIARGTEVTMFNRGKRENTLPAAVKTLAGERNDTVAFERLFAAVRYDVVIDMICFTPEQAASSIRAFAGRCEQFIFCSTVCTYGVKLPPRVLVDEGFRQEPISGYGRNKLQCEQLLLAAHATGKFKLTIIRPSCTYGPGSPLIDQLTSNPDTWDRIERGLPVVMAGDGLGLWQATHRDDCGKLFAFAALNPKTYGQDYNATCDEVFTWRDFYRQAAAALGREVRALFMPAAWIVKHDPARFGLLHEITRFHGAYDSSKAKRDVPEFRCDIGFESGARATLDDVRRRQAWVTAEPVHQLLMDQALAAGSEPVTL